MTARTRIRRTSGWVVGTIAGCLALAACQAPPPDVTFYGNRAAIDTGPTTVCDVDRQASTVECPDPDLQALPRLALHPGDGVQINLPAEIGKAPWWVYFSYLDKDGNLWNGKSSTFDDGRLAYTLKPFASDDQLVSVAVQNDFVLMAGENGGVDFQPTSSWQITIDAATPAAQPAAD